MALLLERSGDLHDIMLKLVLDTLRKHNGNKTRAAKELGVTDRCMRYWVARYDQLQEFKNPTQEFKSRRK